MIYLDYNATAPLHPEVKAAMDEVAGLPLNPSSIHGAGRAARKFVEDSRRAILKSINGEALVFCSSATEANNLVLNQADKYIISAVEHDSIFKTATDAIIISVNKSGIIDLEELERKLSELAQPVLVSIILANNETGIIQPIKAAAKIVHKYKCQIHCDAVQAFGRIDINFKDLEVDFMTISSHKLGGPLGSAALVHKANIEIKPSLMGGGQEKNKHPGTENVVAIHGFGYTATNLNKFVSRETSNNQLYVEQKLKQLGQDIVIHGYLAPRLPNTTYISMPFIESSTQLIHFDTNNICVSSGSACSSGKVTVSRILKAMQAPLAENAIRISTGWQTTREDIDQFIKAWAELYKRARNKAA